MQIIYAYVHIVIHHSVLRKEKMFYRLRKSKKIVKD
jgi:hypothetical protein